MKGPQRVEKPAALSLPEGDVGAWNRLPRQGLTSPVSPGSPSPGFEPL